MASTQMVAGSQVVVGHGGVLNVGVIPQPVLTQPPNLIPQELTLSMQMVFGVQVGLGVGFGAAAPRAV